jgi:hypothetical protein
MAVTQADIDALQKAIGTGASEAQRGDERVKYRSLAEMRSTLAAMKAELAGKPRAARARTMTPRTSRGF